MKSDADFSYLDALRPSRIRELARGKSYWTTVDVLAGDPDFAPALTYRAWEPASLAVSGAVTGGDAETLLEDALVRLDQAVEADPTYADALVFRAIVLKNLGREAEAAEALAAFDATDPPAEMEALVEQFGLREELGE